MYIYIYICTYIYVVLQQSTITHWQLGSICNQRWRRVKIICFDYTYLTQPGKSIKMSIKISASKVNMSLYCNSSYDPERSQCLHLCLFLFVCTHNRPLVETDHLGTSGEWTFSIKGRYSQGPQQLYHKEKGTNPSLFATTHTLKTRFDGRNGNKRLCAHECYHFIPLLWMLQGSLRRSRSNKFTLLN